MRRIRSIATLATVVCLSLVTSLAIALTPNPVEKGLILGTVALAVVFDARRRDEDIFLGNLGIRTRWIAVVALVIPGVMEQFVL